ncbi:hypothetical protein ACFWM7_30785 [Streptomyces sp. NPDC058375]|uniref:hypothetical protein n=1 Tax=Streptomyces sp. NPDC058375 TaxID=3346467 RepID=UPI003657FFC8
MALLIEREQRTMLAHRQNFMGRATSSTTVAWDYHGRTWVLDRPEDGEPARHHSIRCRVCAKTLTYAVHSLAATRRRRVRRWIETFLCLIAGVALYGLIPLDPGSPVVLSVAMGGGALVLTTAWSLGFIARGETGLVGHGSALPGYPKHKLFVPNAEDGRWV